MPTGPQAILFKDIVAMLPEVGARILNVGSGDGVLSQYLRELGYIVEDLDIRSYSVTGVEPIIYDGVTIPFDNNTFDAVLCIYVLHHVDHQKELLGEMSRVSKGQLIVAEDVGEHPVHSVFMLGHSLLGIVRNWGGSCKFQKLETWEEIFEDTSLDVQSNVRVPGRSFYPVTHHLFLLNK